MEEPVSGIQTISSLLLDAPYDKWVLVSPSSSRPAARYKHAAEVVGEKLFLVGGSRNGRYLSDVQVFDFRTLKWSTLNAKKDEEIQETDPSAHIFPPTAGHSMVKWGNKLLVVAGYSKKSSDIIRVWLLDPEAGRWSVVKTYGQVPVARGGQSVTLVGSHLIMFGGEDNRRRPLNDLNILDLETMAWELVESSETTPAPRFDHTATAYRDQYLLIFGGSSSSTCFNDLHLLDLQTMEWSQPESQGAHVNPRGGHAGIIIGESWYLVGGGDNTTGATDTMVLDVARFSWHVSTHVSQRDPLASEGISLSLATVDNEKLILAFGGYNGNYNNEIFVMKPKPRDSARPRILQSTAAAAAAASVTAAYAVVTGTDDKPIDVNVIDDSEIKMAQPVNPSNEMTAQLDALNEDKRVLESKLAAVREDNSRLREKLETINLSHNELMKELQSVQGQLAAESSRCLKLESQIALAKKKLESFESLEQGLVVLRRQISQVERSMTASQKQKSGGVWGWVAGTPQGSDNE